MSVYSATKAAVRSFARSWTVDLKHRKIRVNAVSPGGTDTPMVSSRGLGVSEEQFEQFMKAFTNSVPMGRIGNPDEIAKAVAFLASDDSSYITGIELFVDGGANLIRLNYLGIQIGVMAQNFKPLFEWSLPSLHHDLFRKLFRPATKS
jgi:NAD(P)-dependent dehydrogenase (short-subunit alcohol dehydrogenase family)